MTDDDQVVVRCGGCGWFAAPPPPAPDPLPACPSCGGELSPEPPAGGSSA